MATNALSIFNPQAGAPAHIANFFEDAGGNIAPRTTVPSLSPEGKNWTLALNGEKTKLQRRNADGDLEPLAVMKVVVLDYAKQRGRAYYEGDYDPNKVSAPICWSDDGVAPDASLPGPFAAGTEIEPGSSRKISAACANCPMAVKGSKVDRSGKAMVACSQHRMLAVVPDPAMGLKDIPPLRLKIAITSDWDKDSPQEEQQGWFAFSRYADFLNSKGVKHTAALVTKMKFDVNAAFPKIFFSAERYLEPHELAVIAPLTKSDDVKKLLGGTWTPAGVDGVPKDQQKVAQAGAATDQLAVPQQAVEYRMADGETFTEAQYLASGWTREQLITGGKLVPVAAPAPAAPAPAAPPAPPAPPVPPTAESVVVVGEPAGAATPATASPPAPAATAEVVVVGETAPPAAPPAPAAVLAPAAEVVQEPAQAAAPAPAAPPAPPEPPKAAEAAAAAAPAVGTDVDPALAALLDQWT